MRNVFCIFMAIVLVFGLSGCGASPATAEVSSWLQAGFARVDVTPGFHIGLDGSGNADTRISTGIADKISVTCVALADENQTILVFSADTLGFNNTILSLLRPQLQLVTGVPQSNLFFGSTHTHSAPRLLLKTEEGTSYLGIFCEAVVAAGQMAMSDLAPAKLQAATTNLPGMNFIRHYKMSDGSYAGPNFGTFDGLDIVDYAGTADPELSLIKLSRSGDKKDILLMNWQAHPNNSTAIGYYKISADFVGYARNKLEAETGMQVAYFTGASGNVHIDSKIESHKHGLPWNAYGEKLAELTIAALPLLQDVGGTGIAVTGKAYLAPLNHSWDHAVEQAEKVMNVLKTQGQLVANDLCKQYDFTSHHQARTILELAKLGKSLQLELRAFRVGDLGFTTGTYEMWTESGKAVKDASPFDVTFIITGNLIYIPEEEAYDYRCYEADTGYFEKGTAEALVQEYISLLNAVK